MGRYLSTNSCSSTVNKTLRSFCKIRYLMILLRKYPCLTMSPFCRRVHGNSWPSFPPPSIFPKRKPAINTFYLRDYTKEAKHLQSEHLYASSSKSTFKTEAPIGVTEEARDSLNVSGRLSQSFSQLSRHINIYFKRKDIVPQCDNPCLVLTTSKYPGKSQRQSQQMATEQTISNDKDKILECKDEQEISGTAPSTRGDYGVQLFHISSLATAFGESYSYVAKHINSIFSRSFAQVPAQENLETTALPRSTHTMQKKRKMLNSCIGSSEKTEKSRVNLDAIKATDNVASSRVEGYLHFARHINKYFGAKVADDQDQSTYKKHFPTQSIAQGQGGMSQPMHGEPVTTESRSLFHSSRNATNFGENYFQMASHINQYFKGQSESDDDLQVETDPGSVTVKKSISFIDCLCHPTSAIPDLLGTYLKLGPFTQTGKQRPVMTSPKAKFHKKVEMNQRQAEETTRGLIGSLTQASSPETLTACMEALNDHLICHPSCKTVMWQEKTAVTLLKKRRAYRDNQALQSALRETLALIGYMDPVRGRGIKVLSIDGGGTRGVVPLQVLKLLEAETGKKIHQLFDYICGVSTGAVLAFMLGLAHFSLEECADMYRRFGSEVFRQNPLVGTVKMGWNHSYYDTETWETVLQEKLGHKLLIKTARDESSPKVSAVSAVVNWGTSPKAFVFRNYNHKPGSLSRYAGASGCRMWQAVRASSAAPGYFQEFPLQCDIHQDGGIILNNPCALAVHESRLLWPNQPFQCVLSLGTGRYDNVKKTPATSTSLRAKISNLICSATDTEGVHTLLDDLLAPDVYFRFNPMLSTLVSLDESRPQALDQLQRDTQSYLERNTPKLTQLCLVLAAERSAVQRTKDCMSERAWEMKQRWI